MKYALILILCCATTLAQGKSDALQAALNHELRPAADKARDGDRKPAEVLSFFGITPGMHVADLMAGGGFYSEIVARFVGPEGKVYAQNNRIALKRFADKALGERLAKGELTNVVRLDRELEDPGLPESGLDAVLLVLFFHDTYWMEVDRKAMLAQIYKSLKPGAVFGVIDHAAADGSGSEHAKSLHRVEESLLRTEITAAGFTYDGPSEILRNPQDDRGTNVFLAQIRGKTDRFVHRYRKPR
ncbi:MAG: putative methyltransferase [Rhodothermales bacterium]|jgi:predicted methyltransferase